MNIIHNPNCFICQNKLKHIRYDSKSIDYFYCSSLPSTNESGFWYANGNLQTWSFIVNSMIYDISKVEKLTYISDIIKNSYDVKCIIPIAPDPVQCFQELQDLMSKIAKLSRFL